MNSAPLVDLKDQECHWEEGLLDSLVIIILKIHRQIEDLWTQETVKVRSYDKAGEHTVVGHHFGNDNSSSFLNS